MPRLIDISGQVFGHLTVLSRVPATGQAKWLCHCSCGKTTIQPGNELRSGKIKSCGCMRTKWMLQASTTHGMTRSKEWTAWLNMRNRCYRKNVPCYPRYGGLGIRVCDQWNASFESFYADMGKCPDGYSLDRIDPCGHYCPENCRWADLTTQANNKRNVVNVTFNGETKPITIWCRELGLPVKTIKARILYYGWSIEEALATPVRR